jgi:phosphatidylinositol 4-kinase B
LATGPECGLVEACVDSASISSIKEKMGGKSTLLDFFKMQFGPDKKSRKYKVAQQNFIRSLAAYSLICYIL